MSHYEKLKAMKTGFSDDFRTAIYAQSISSKDYERYISGTPPLILSDSVGKPLVNWSITGNTIQSGTPTPDNPVEIKGTGDKTGNLLDVKKLYPTTEFIYNGDTISGNSVSFANCIINLSQYVGKRITFSAILKKTSEITRVYLRAFIGTQNIDSESVYESDKFQFVSVSFTVSSIDDTVLITYGNGRGIVSAKNIMLNEGTEPLPYEPYGYKITEVTRGKNLFDFDKWKKYLISKQVPVTRGTITFEDNNSFKITANSTDAYTSHLDNEFTIPINPNEKYTLSWNASNNNHGLVYVFPNGLTTGFASADNNANKKLSFQYSTLVTFVTIRFGVTNAGDSIVYSSIMLNEGSTATEYEPYVSPITTPIYLNSPLMADEVLKSDGSREVEWGKLVLTGDERWVLWGEHLYSNVIDSSAKQNINIFCSHFISDVDNRIGMYLDSGSSRLVLRKNSFPQGITDDVTFKQYLKSEYEKGTPVTVWYRLATPTSETVSVPQIPTFKGNTVLDVDTEVQPTNMSVTYKSRR